MSSNHSPSDSTRPASELRRYPSIIWIGLSFLLSGGMLVWAFSTPFRTSPTTLESLKGERVKHVVMNADEVADFQANIRAEHDAYLHDLRARKSKIEPSEAKSPAELQAHWENRRQRVQAELLLINNELETRDVRDDSMLWQDREYLQKVLDDA